MKRTILALSLLLSPQIALSCEKTQSNEFYITVSPVYSMNKGNDTSLDGVASNQVFKDSYNNTGGMNIGVGYKIDNNFRASIDWTHLPGINHTHHNKYKGVDKNDPNKTIDILSYYQTEIASDVLMVNLFYDINEFEGPITPFIFGGIGLAQNKISNVTQSVNPSSANLFYNTYYSKTKTNFAWNVGFGASTKINKKMNFDISYKYMSLGDVKSADAVADSNSTSSNNPFIGKDNTVDIDDLRSHQVLFGVRFNLN